MNNQSFRDSYDILLKIYLEGAFANEEMKSVTNKRTTKIVYGVLDKHYELEYIVDSLTDKVKGKYKPLLYICAYSLLYMDTPKNVVLNEVFEVLDGLGKGALKPFFSAVVNKVNGREYSLPTKSDKRYLEVKYNLPSFLVGLFRKDYPDDYDRILTVPNYDRVHVRLAYGQKEDIIKAADPTAIPSGEGYFVKNNKEISLLNFEGKLTYMSYTSVFAAESIMKKAGNKALILDCCAAPGGKSVYFAERGAEVIACDIYPHRVELIESYARRMKVKLTAFLSDATVYDADMAEKFDVVYADVPCSGMGVINRRKDVVFNKTYDDILSLVKLQKKIINNVSKYVKKGGLLVYSTCTVFSMENGKVVEEFLTNNDDFSPEPIEVGSKVKVDETGGIQFLPDGNGTEGFYLCHLRKK